MAIAALALVASALDAMDEGDGVSRALRPGRVECFPERSQRIGCCLEGVDLDLPVQGVCILRPRCPGHGYRRFCDAASRCCEWPWRLFLLSMLTGMQYARRNDQKE